jgi:hypothetical protein
MTFPKTISAVFFTLAGALAGLQTTRANSCTSIESITCVQTTSSPTVDAKISDWDGVEVFETPLTGALTSTIYGAGNIKIQCVYDTNNIYLLYQIPGKYMFDSSDNHKCAAVGNMFQVGEKASFFNMGNCPLSEAAGCDAVPGGCAPWAVDIAPQWELRRTERGTEYGPNTGNNGNHEFGITPYCRVDAPSNEWSAAWDFSGNATDGEKGDYIFEFSRPLTTSSPDMDIQLTAGTEVGFGVAFWDPNEKAGGWSDSGHYVTGCSADWIGLRLVDENGDATPVFNGESSTAESDATTTASGGDPTASKTPSSGAIASVVTSTLTFIAAIVAYFADFEAFSSA